MNAAGVWNAQLWQSSIGKKRFTRVKMISFSTPNFLSRLYRGLGWKKDYKFDRDHTVTYEYLINQIINEGPLLCNLTSFQVLLASKSWSKYFLAIWFLSRLNTFFYDFSSKNKKTCLKNSVLVLCILTSKRALHMH